MFKDAVHLRCDMHRLQNAKDINKNVDCFENIQRGLYGYKDVCFILLE